MRRPSRFAFSWRPATFALLLAGSAIGLSGGCAGPARRSPGAAGIIQAAQQEAAGAGDPVAAKLAIWLRAQAGPETGTMASASEIDAFLRANPDWPGQAVMRQHLQEALASEPDDRIARNLCMTRTPDTSPSLLRCLTVLSPQSSSPASLPYSLSNLPPMIAAAARAAWVAGMDDPTDETAFLRLFAPLPSPADQWRRFDRQEWSGAIAAARRQVARLAPGSQRLAAARIALRAGDDGADRMAASLHGADAQDATLLLDVARWRRRHDQDDAALALWQGPLQAAERGSTHVAAYWTERDALARELLSQHRDQEALFLAQDDAQTDPSSELDSDFLTGWILLRRLHQPDRAVLRFAELPRNSHSAITTSRGYYWLGQALDAEGRTPDASASYGQAALRPTTFYGQAAIRARAAAASAAGKPNPAIQPNQGATAPDAGPEAALIATLHDPSWTQDDAIRFAGLELARAATLLVAWGDARHARGFLLKLDGMGDDDRDHALAASLANRLGLPDVAVAIARTAGRHGLILAQAGWPAPYALPVQPILPPGLALAVMRQESSFDPDVVSPPGARGLMQLMPATARTMMGNPAETPPLADPDINMALGTRYLASLLAQFSGSTAYAAAAYNAGPARVRQWLQQTGNPPGAGDAPPDPTMIDWIEMIPFAETRNYVQRVIESEAVYRARGTTAAADHIAWSPAPAGAPQ